MMRPSVEIVDRGSEVAHACQLMAQLWIADGDLDEFGDDPQAQSGVQGVLARLG
ncbi:hypothetical protein [Nocardia xishanensis]